MDTIEHDALSQALLKKIPKKTITQKAIKNAFKLTAHLSNLLPTGSVLVFQTLTPIFTNGGKCQTQVSITLTSILLSICCISCFVLCFTDSFHDKKGKVRYVIATFSGLWVIDGSTRVPPEKASEYKIKLIDVFHGLLSVEVFGTIAMFDKNVVDCFYPKLSEEFNLLVSILPIGVGVLCSLLFGVFPTTRHGIGFPVTER
ncbi:protein DMP4-like [Rutidosis leptorrhynchoides]|uniref:protein DMP4-like n=1 Tax=Rutidosis leptorrhynchoides TaxID=125765 RepID=UPI003A98F302